MVIPEALDGAVQLFVSNPPQIVCSPRTLLVVEMCVENEYWIASWIACGVVGTDNQGTPKVCFSEKC